MAARKRMETDRTTDRDTPGRTEAALTDPSWRIVAICAVLLIIYLWLHADALRLLLSGFASR
jgi:hypothetical protein